MHKIQVRFLRKTIGLKGMIQKFAVKSFAIKCYDQLSGVKCVQKLLGIRSLKPIVILSVNHPTNQRDIVVDCT